MKKHLHAILWVTCLAMGLYLPTQAQSVTIDPSNVTTGQIIEAKSTKKGLLLPVMNQAQRTALSTPVAGVQIYCTDCSSGAGTYTYNGSVWVPMFNTAGITYIVGQNAQGGKVFFVDDTGQHGLVVATAELAGSFPWISSSNMNTNAIRSGIYGGQYNTELINKAQGNGSSAALAAAQYSDVTVTGAYGDWYLPSKIELSKLYAVKSTIGLSSLTAIYWSSTEVVAAYGSVSETANYINFANGAAGTAAKSTAYKVIAIRRF